MAERRGRERIFEIDPVKRPKGRFLRLLIAKYVGWVEAFGYIFCAAVATGIIFCWVYRVDEVANEKEIGKTLIKPREKDVIHDKEAVATRLATTEWQLVGQGDPVVEVCADADWIQRYKAIQELEKFAKGLRELEKEAALPADIARQVMDAEKQVEAWNAGEGPKGARTLISAPCAGEVTGTQDIVGKLFKADQPICKVVDFNDLRLNVKLGGTNVERVRVGMPAKINVVPEYGLGCPVRADVKLGWLRSTRVEFNYVLDGETAKTLLFHWWKEQPVKADEDANREIALTPSSVEEVEVVCALRSNILTESEAEKIPRSDYLEADLIGGQNPQMGLLVEGKHTGTYTTNYLSPQLRQEMEQKLTDLLNKKVVKVSGDQAAPVLQITGVKKLHNFLKIKAAVSDLNMEQLKGESKGETLKGSSVAGDEKAAADEEWRRQRAEMNERFAEAAAKAVDADKEKTERYFEGVVFLHNPTPVLSQKVKEAYQNSPSTYLKAKVEIVVGRCRLAMLLFRQ